MARLAVAAAGAAIGFAVGGPMGARIGWTAGLYVGNMIFSEDLPTQEGPRILQNKVTSSTFGQPIATIYGTTRIAGNIIWAADIKETRHETTQSQGKGGSQSQTTVTFTYSADFAVGLCNGPISGVRKIWADSILLYDASEANTTASIHESLTGLYIYKGTETQTADPLIETYEGVGQVPAHRGLAYVVFDTLQLQQFGNRIPNVTFEVVNSGNSTHVFQYAIGAAGFDIFYQEENESIRGGTGLPKGMREWDIYASSATQLAAGSREPGTIEYNKFDKQTGFVQSGGAGTEYNFRYNVDGAEVRRTVQSWRASRIVATGAGKWVGTQNLNSETNFFDPYVSGLNNSLIQTHDYNGAINAMVFDDVNQKIWAAPYDWAATAPPLFVISEDNWIVNETYISAGSSSGWPYGGLTTANGYIWAVDRNTTGNIFKIDGANASVVAVASGLGWAPNGYGPIVYSDVTDTIFAITSGGRVGEFNANTLARVGVYATAIPLNGQYPKWMTYAKRSHAVYIHDANNLSRLLLNRLGQNTISLASTVAAICSSAGLTAADIDVSALTSTTVQGYATDQTSARRQLAPLMQTYFFDAVESDFKIKFVRRL